MTTDLFGTSPAIPSDAANSKHHGRRALTLGVAASAAIALFIGGIGGTALAAQDTTVVHVGVDPAIALSGLTSAFTLNGAPGGTITENGAVTMNVQTNNIGGYSVTVRSETPTLVAGAVGNVDAILIDLLHVRETGTTTFQPMSNLNPVMVHLQGGRSVPAGDVISNDFLVDVPFVATDTYSATLDYVVTTL